MLGLGLKEAKDLVDKPPCVLKKGVKSEDAKSLQKKLTDIGCTIKLLW